MKTACLHIGIVIVIVTVTCQRASSVATMSLSCDSSAPLVSAVCPIDNYPVWIEMYIWCHPSSNGQLCAEFALSYPENAAVGSEPEFNPTTVTDVIGDLGGGIKVCYGNCQYEWHWCLHQTLWIITPDCTTVDIIEHPGLNPPEYRFTTCLPGNPTESLSTPTSLLLNQYDYWGCYPPNIPVAANVKTWGAIKQLLGYSN